MVTRKRHLAKAVTYRFFGSSATFGAALFMTGSTRISFGVFLIDTVSKVALYYLHERAWYHFKWGIVPGGAQESAGASDKHPAPRAAPAHSQKAPVEV